MKNKNKSTMRTSIVISEFTYGKIRKLSEILGISNSTLVSLILSDTVYLFHNNFLNSFTEFYSCFNATKPENSSEKKPTISFSINSKLRYYLEDMLDEYQEKNKIRITLSNFFLSTLDWYMKNYFNKLLDCLTDVKSKDYTQAVPSFYKNKATILGVPHSNLLSFYLAIFLNQQLNDEVDANMDTSTLFQDPLTDIFHDITP